MVSAFQQNCQNLSQLSQKLKLPNGWGRRNCNFEQLERLSSRSATFAANKEQLVQLKESLLKNSWRGSSCKNAVENKENVPRSAHQCFLNSEAVAQELTSGVGIGVLANRQRGRFRPRCLWNYRKISQYKKVETLYLRTFTYFKSPNQQTSEIYSKEELALLYKFFLQYLDVTFIQTKCMR